MESPIKMDALGYHYFWKHPYIDVPFLKVDVYRWRVFSPMCFIFSRFDDAPPRDDFFTRSELEY